MKYWGKGKIELPYIPSTSAKDEMIEECADVDFPPPQRKQTAVNYVKEPYDYFSSLSTEMPAITR